MEYFLLGEYDSLNSEHDKANAEEFDYQLQEVGKFKKRYLDHPGLSFPGHLAQHRLSDLGLVYRYMWEIRERKESLIAAYMPTNNEQSHLLNKYNHLSKRQLKHLWANLLGVK
ncbi:hypothetical protein GO988_02495 [Hymenobacter sp. HMF4947]|uniref:Uncharacterized protein n=1 Tax=Hymenobacter ginkgonis TaxID=2682976 RepID=A0A7K1T9W3_9BACT|nr:hypothetical protein [Hymenobacter ginkgonis]MVN75185.1 hypothetical protein [Hymenobacter ginkgonis]